MQTEVLSKIAQIVEARTGLEVRIVPLPMIQSASSAQRYRVYLTMGTVNPLHDEQYEEIKFNIEAGSERQVLQQILRRYELLNAHHNGFNNSYDDHDMAAAR